MTVPPADATPALARGRPRDTAATLLLRHTALEIVEELGFDGLSVEAVAARAGVAKTTIYRRWRNVWSLLMEAFLAAVTRLAPIEYRGSARESLADSLRHLASAFRGRPGKVLGLLLGRAQTEAELADAFWTRWVEPRRVLARDIIQRGISSGELRKGLNADVAIDALYGALYYRLLIPYAPMTDEYIDQLIDTVLSGMENPARSEQAE